MFIFFIFYNRFWTASGTKTTRLVVLWDLWRSGGSCAIKKAPDSGICQQKTELNWDLQQRAVRGGGHVDRTSASPCQPLRTSRSGWVSHSLELVCVSVDMSMWTRCGHKTYLLHFVTGMIWSRIRISSFCYLSATFCQPTAIKASDFMSVSFSPYIERLSLISSFFTP